MDSEVSDDQLLDFQRDIAIGIVTKLNAVRRAGPVAVAIEMIVRRVVESGNSLAALRGNSPHDYGFDAASILRDIYDVTLQGLYILADPTERDERARLYLDFMDIEIKRRIDLMDASGTDIAKRISSSPKRPEAEPVIEKRFEAVKANYANKKGKLRDRWYPGSLGDLAKAVNLKPEYELMQRFLSGVVHSSPLTLKERPCVRDYLLMVWHWHFAFRILGAYAEYKGVALSKMEEDMIDSARKNVFDLH